MMMVLRSVLSISFRIWQSADSWKWLYISFYYQAWAHKQYIEKHLQGPSQQWGNFYYFRMQNIRLALLTLCYYTSKSILRTKLVALTAWGIRMLENILFGTYTGQATVISLQTNCIYEDVLYRLIVMFIYYLHPKSMIFSCWRRISLEKLVHDSLR